VKEEGGVAFMPRLDEPFDETMILFDQIVEIFLDPPIKWTTLNLGCIGLVPRWYTFYGAFWPPMFSFSDAIE
jgi:hypothetical protein